MDGAFRRVREPDEHTGHFTPSFAIPSLAGGGPDSGDAPYYRVCMAFPIKTCVVCSEEFELRPGKPGFANRCPQCSADEVEAAPGKRPSRGDETTSEMNAERRKAIRDLLYRKDS